MEAKAPKAAYRAASRWPVSRRTTSGATTLTATRRAGSRSARVLRGTLLTAPRRRPAPPVPTAPIVGQPRWTSTGGRVPPPGTRTAVGAPVRRAPPGTGRHAGAVFLFFSNRLGCFGSLLLSLALTLLLFFI